MRMLFFVHAWKVIFKQAELRANRRRKVLEIPYQMKFIFVEEISIALKRQYFVPSFTNDSLVHMNYWVEGNFMQDSEHIVDQENI